MFFYYYLKCNICNTLSFHYRNVNTLWLRSCHNNLCSAPVSVRACVHEKCARVWLLANSLWFIKIIVWSAKRKSFTFQGLELHWGSRRTVNRGVSLYEKTTLGFPVSHSRMYSEAASHLCWAVLLHQFSPESHFFFPFSSFQVNVDDTIEMLPKSRRALTIPEIAALARSSLHGECSVNI